MKPLYTRIGGSAEDAKHFFERSAVTRKIRRKLRNGDYLKRSGNAINKVINQIRGLSIEVSS